MAHEVPEAVGGEREREPSVAPPMELGDRDGSHLRSMREAVAMRIKVTNRTRHCERLLADGDLIGVGARARVLARERLQLLLVQFETKNRTAIRGGGKDWVFSLAPQARIFNT